MKPKPEQRRYTVTYHDDPALAIVYDDDTLFATWHRLRIGADAAWPSATAVPRRCSEDALTRLVEAGLVELQPGDHYRMAAIDAERAAKVEQASRAGEASKKGAKRGPRGRFLPRRDQPTPNQRPLASAPTPVGEVTNGPPTAVPTGHQRPTNPPDQRAGAKDTSPYGTDAVAGDGTSPVPGVPFREVLRKVPGGKVELVTMAGSDAKH